MKKLNTKGFTLAELLIVVAIIAVLVAIAIPVFSNQLERAKIAADEANVRSWYGEVVSEHLGSGAAWPTSYGGALQAQGGAVACATDSNDANLWTVTYTANKLSGSFVLSTASSASGTSSPLPAASSSSSSSSSSSG